MDAEILNLLCTPVEHRPLGFASGGGLSDDQGRLYPIREGIPVLLPTAETRAWQRFYDRAAFAYDATVQLGARLGLGSELRIRAELLSQLALPAGAVVLDVGCGTGANRPAFGTQVTYLGLDLSFGMLHRAQRNCARLSLASHFVQADAAALPVRAGRADVALAMGILQHVPNPQAALNELARVAQRIFVIDERRSLRNLNRKLASRGPALDDLGDWVETHTGLEVLEAKPFGEYYLLECRQTHLL